MAAIYLLIAALIASSHALAAHGAGGGVPLAAAAPLPFPGDLAASGKLRTDPNATVPASMDFGNITAALPAAVLFPGLPRRRGGAPARRLRRPGAAVHRLVPRPRPLHHGPGPSPPAASSSTCSPWAAAARRGSTCRRTARTWTPAASSCGSTCSRAALARGVAPRSWTDYLHLTVGGTLSNAGVSGQTYRHGPQISNVLELDVITGHGETVTCSKAVNSDLFDAVLGGLGQFGVITRARVAVEPAPARARWVRLVYADFAAFSADQERLVAARPDGSHGPWSYVEGAVYLAGRGLAVALKSSGGFFSDADAARVVALAAARNATAVVQHRGDASTTPRTRRPSSVDPAFPAALGYLHFEQGSPCSGDFTYEGFPRPGVRQGGGPRKGPGYGASRTRGSTCSSRAPASPTSTAASSRASSRRPPTSPDLSSSTPSTNPSKHNTLTLSPTLWDAAMSAVTPEGEEEVFYVVSLLFSAVANDVAALEAQNRRILRFCDLAGIGYKAYLAHYDSRGDWVRHFGAKWDRFVQRKDKYDPKKLLSPGQDIFN
ncbi:hypothetical protein OsJ_00684 [Oryza sativa Japonica Group]|uniref:Cytokinin dehydrogenase 1 FAD/cytokinin binding domain-containing protein n=1 Tax=Oryza sativa subsp. japonica TaxID=39947 RepID=B9ETK0_ORYSJ|nr:hypothetical protein OsJ_00684 [Oryza sativa Japonica Group]